jgi:hypothetical protein
VAVAHPLVFVVQTVAALELVIEAARIPESGADARRMASAATNPEWESLYLGGGMKEFFTKTELPSSGKFLTVKRMRHP